MSDDVRGKQVRCFASGWIWPANPIYGCLRSHRLFVEYVHGRVVGGPIRWAAAGPVGNREDSVGTGPITGPLVSPVDSLGRFAAVLKCVEEDVCHVLVGESVDRGASVAFHLHQAGCPQGA